MIADELIRKCELESLLVQLRREDKTPKQRGYTNMIIVTGGEGPSETYVPYAPFVRFSSIYYIMRFWLGLGKKKQNARDFALGKLSYFFRGEITPLSSSYNIPGLVPVCWLLFQKFDYFDPVRPLF